jgi:hypothetical protein
MACNVVEFACGVGCARNKKVIYASTEKVGCG